MILVLNFGGQYAHLLPRRVRELGAYSEILPCDVPLEHILSLKPAGIIFSGGPASVYAKGAPKCDRRLFAAGIPILGICYGHQLTAQEMGGKVVGGRKKEYGRAKLSLEGRSKLFKNLKGKQEVWFSHGDSVAKMPPGFRRIASTRTCRIAGMEDDGRKIYGVQFHPEVTHTPCGMRVLSNFIFGICCEPRDWKARNMRQKLVAQARREIGKERVLMAVSGGVDSLVAATLLHEAVGDRAYAVFIDTGLLRKDEAEEAVARLRKTGFRNVVKIDASREFLTRLKGVAEPEAKRRVIGHTFIRVFEKATAALGRKKRIAFLGQGTIYPDRIESAQPSSHASKIKSHHNLTLPARMKFKIIEPLKELYKDEVRALGKELGLPKESLWRHPFPGPGLAVRVVGEVTPERLAILREADAIFIEELRRFGWYDKTWQALAALLPVKAVGVKGDERSYDYVIALRAVNSVDGMTADWTRLPPELLERASSRIVNEVRGVNRVLYDVTQKPPATIEFE